MSRRALALLGLTLCTTCTTASGSGTPLAVASPAQLSVAFEGEACTPRGPAPRLEDALEVEDDGDSRRFWRFEGCFPVKLAETSCDWACAGWRGGWCGNGGATRWLVFLRSTGGASRVAGKIALTDSESFFARSFHTEPRPDGARRIVAVVSTGSSREREVEIWRLDGDKLLLGEHATLLGR